MVLLNQELICEKHRKDLTACKSKYGSASPSGNLKQESKQQQQHQYITANIERPGD